ncbi:MAG: metalloprotease TldD [Betaproteobacteria bacterium TMED82]|nr:MAG: metalloprotease TldD [Betaproteobacteria bacterium TMED82]|tara:strand:- start:56864 stop:58345 length:1482 start_codon:yes stop_codon:yes gene_type:complete
MLKNRTKESKEIATSLLLTPHDIGYNLLEEVHGIVKRHKIDYSDIYFQYLHSESWSLDEGIVKSGSFSIDQGFGVRAVSGEKSAFSYSDSISRRSLIEAATATQNISASGQQGKNKVENEKSHSYGKKESKTNFLYSSEDPLAALRSEEKVEMLHSIEARARRKDPRICQVMGSIVGSYSAIIIMRGDGELVFDVRPLIRVSITAVAESKGRREFGVSGGGGRFSLSDLGSQSLDNYIEQATRQALVNLESKPAPAGIMSVVLGPGWPGILLHEAVGHGLEGDFNRKGSSVFAGRIGERVAAKGVTVVDDGTLENRRGSLNVDDEGNPSSSNVLIEDGILKCYMQDILNSRLMNVSPTGNGRRESFAHLPMPRMTNTFMRAGDCEPEEIVANLKEGLYAANFGGGQVDITNGKFVFSASEAYWVEKGKIKYPVKGATLIGNGPDSLTKIKMIGNDLKFDTGVGTCGKEGQRVPVGVGQPTIFIDGLTVGGTVG